MNKFFIMNHNSRLVCKNGLTTNNKDNAYIEYDYFFDKMLFLLKEIENTKEILENIKKEIKEI